MVKGAVSGAKMYRLAKGGDADHPNSDGRTFFGNIYFFRIIIKS